MGRKRNPKYLVEWVDTLCKDWGREMRQKYIVDGYPTRSFFATYTEGRQTGYFSFNQHWPEFLTADVREMSKEFRRLYESDYAGEVVLAAVLFSHYVVRDMTIEKRCECLALTISTYYRKLRKANEILSRRLDRQPEFDNRNKIDQNASQSILSG